MLALMQEYMPVNLCLMQLKLLEKFQTMLIPFQCWKKLMPQLMPWVPQQPALLPSKTRFELSILIPDLLL